MSPTPFLRFPYLFVRSTCKRLRKRSFRSAVKCDGKRTWEGKELTGDHILKLFIYPVNFQSSVFFVTSSTGQCLQLSNATIPLPSQIQSFHISVLADQQRRVDNQQPFHRLEHLKPTNRQLCYNPTSKHKFCKVKYSTYFFIQSISKVDKPQTRGMNGLVYNRHPCGKIKMQLVYVWLGHI